MKIIACLQSMVSLVGKSKNIYTCIANNNKSTIFGVGENLCLQCFRQVVLSLTLWFSLFLISYNLKIIKILSFLWN